MLAEAGTALVFPIVRGDGDKGFAWAMASAAPHRQRAVDDLVAVAQATAAALPMLSDRPTVRGQSAGGWLAVKAVLERPDLFAGAIGYSGAYLMAGEPFAEQNTQRFFDPQADDLAKDVKALAGNCRGLRFRLLHARDDEKVPFESVAAFAGELRAQGCAVEEVSFDHGGHLIALDLSRVADAERRLRAYFTPF
jgi:dipeptidyl aminopeptidase/acylaminoacyl peptidase